MPSRAWVVLPLGLLLALPARAQEDEQTREYEEQDRRYLQQQLGQQEAQAAPDGQTRLAAFLERADELIRDRNYSSDSSPHYRVQTDDPRLRAEQATRLLEAFRTFFDGFWPDSLPLRPYDSVSRAFLFYSFYKFDQLIEGDFRFRSYRPKGHYGADLDAITLHTDAADGGTLADALIHEAAHQLVVQRLFGGSRVPPLWINEGLATYFGFTFADEQGRFLPAAIGGKSVDLIRDAPKDRGTERKHSLQTARDALRAASKESRPLIERVVSIEDPDEFYGGDGPLNYATSWVLVHFLLHGEEGAHAIAFQRYIELERSGRGGPLAFFEAIQLTPAELEAAVTAYVKGLQAR